MQLLQSNIKKGAIKLKAECPDDLWHLYNIISRGDFVSGKTMRKIKKEGKDERASKAVKKPVFIKIEVEKAEFSKSTAMLRVAGKVVEGPEDIARGSYHTLNIEPGSTRTIEKQKWLSFQVEKLKEASKAKPPRILICVMDREEVYFAKMLQYGYEVLSHITGEVQKKGSDEISKQDFYSEIIKKIEEYDNRYKLEIIIMASPAFFKEDLAKRIPNGEIKQKIILATCSSVGKNGIDEVLKRDETRNALSRGRVSREIGLVDELLIQIRKERPVAYGMEETRTAAEAGAVRLLLVTDSLIQKKREEDKFDELDSIMGAVDSAKGSVHIVSSGNEAGKKLDGLGGIGAVLRYRIS